GATVIATDLHDAAPVEGAVYRRLDVSRQNEWDDLGAFIASEFGRLDGLVNNAGIPFRARVDEVKLEDWNRVLSVNLTGPLLGIQTAIPLMENGGSIVHVSSLAGLISHYAAASTGSRWGVRGLSRAASMELGPRGIRVNAIFPGFIDTPMTASAPAAFRTSNVEATPLGRVGTADEVA